MNSPEAAVLPVSGDLLDFAQRLTRDPTQPFGMTGVSVAVYPWHDKPSIIHVGCDANGTALNEDSIYCLASVGKMAIALLILDMVSEGKAELGTRVGEVVPRATGEVRSARLDELLSHRGGLRTYLPHSEIPYNENLEWTAIEAACLREDRPHYGEGVRYSDIAYGLLGIVLETAWEMPLAEVIEKRLNLRLGTSLSLFPDATEGFSGVVPVPHINASQHSPRIASMNSAFWRKLGLPWVGIHGRFADMQRLLVEFTPLGSLLQASIREAAIELRDDGLAGGIPLCGEHMGIGGASPLQWKPCAWGLGPELKGTKNTHWTPREASPRSFGHVGTSGVLAWCDPDAKVIWTIAGTRGSYSGWILRHGPTLGRIALAHASKK